MSDLILHKEGFISKDHCQSLIDYFELNSEHHIEGVVGCNNKVDYSLKKCKELVFFGKDYDLPILQPLLESLCNATNLYKKAYSFIDTLALWNISPAFKMQRYNPGEGYFVNHCENDGNCNGETERRLIAWMVYLNDVFDGGHTAFPYQDKKFQPRTGDILLWPAYWTHPHHGIPSSSQIKYIVTGWFTYTND